MIRVENMHKHFGGFRAVDGATLEIAEGSITGLLHFERRDYLRRSIFFVCVNSFTVRL